MSYGLAPLRLPRDTARRLLGFLNCDDLTLPCPVMYLQEIPKPTDPELEIVTYPETTRYVRVFGGYASEGKGTPMSCHVESTWSRLQIRSCAHAAMAIVAPPCDAPAMQGTSSNKPWRSRMC